MLLRNKNNKLYLVSKKYWNNSVPDIIADTKEYREKYISELLETSKTTLPSEIIDYLLYDLHYNMYDEEHEKLLEYIYGPVTALEKMH